MPEVISTRVGCSSEKARTGWRHKRQRRSIQRLAVPRYRVADLYYIVRGVGGRTRGGGERGGRKGGRGKQRAAPLSTRREGRARNQPRLTGEGADQRFKTFNLSPLTASRGLIKGRYFTHAT